MGTQPAEASKAMQAMSANSEEGTNVGKELKHMAGSVRGQVNGDMMKEVAAKEVKSQKTTGKGAVC